MQKILHIVESLASGIHTFLVDLANHQCDDFDVYIAYGVRPQTRKDFKDCFDKRVHWIKVENFQRSVGLEDVRAFFELKRIVREVNPDIIHLHSSKAGFLGRWACNCSKRKVFYTPNGLSFLMQDSSKLKRLFYWFLEYVSTFRKATTVACGKGEYEATLQLSKRCTYVNNGININDLQLFLREETFINKTQPVACVTGRISYQKNPKLFNEIAELLPQVKFIWIGEGELQAELKSSNIEVTGWVDRKVALGLVVKADFFILPSLWEGLPLSLLEAMYLKKICLVSDIIGNRDAIDNGRNGFICHSADEYAQRINQVLQNKYNQKSLTHQAHNDILNVYNTNIMAAQYTKIYNQ
jgi:glycosyltransferase involved in cell wall biosynthesis